jgi:hypothetical protein
MTLVKSAPKKVLPKKPIFLGLGTWQNSFLAKIIFGCTFYLHLLEGTMNFFEN